MARAKKPLKKKSRTKKNPPARPVGKPKRKPKPKPKPKHKSTAQLSPRNRKKLEAAGRAASRKKQRLENIGMQLDAEGKAYRARLAKKAKADAKKKRKAKAQARQLATRARKGGQQSLLFTLEAAYETMRQASPTALALVVEHSPTMEYGREPWLLLGRFITEEAMTWQDAGELFQLWENDLVLEATVHPNRGSYMRVVYQPYDEDGEPVGEPQGFSVNSGRWNAVISEMRIRAIGDPGIYDEDAFSVLYAGASIIEIVVWWSASLL